MDYKKKSLKNLNRNESYEEIDTRLASGWYVDVVSGNKKKKSKTKEVVFKIAKTSYPHCLPFYPLIFSTKVDPG